MVVGHDRAAPDAAPDGGSLDPRVPGSPAYRGGAVVVRPRFRRVLLLRDAVVGLCVHDGRLLRNEEPGGELRTAVHGMGCRRDHRADHRREAVRHLRQLHQRLLRGFGDLRPGAWELAGGETARSSGHGRHGGGQGSFEGGLMPHSTTGRGRRPPAKEGTCPYKGVAYVELRAGHDQIYFGRWRRMDASSIDLRKAYRQLERLLREIAAAP